MNNYKLGSLFDGSGGFPLAGALCGIEPVWASEVEPYPIAVTKSRFPKMKHLGDISKINGGTIEPVDIITFGSPCQDLSVAGKRAGLKHTDNGDDETTRSGLFMEAVRIIKEMRNATNGEYPKFCIWENVPGAFSSNAGEDFRIVCEELIKIVEPSASMPSVPQKGWNYADSFVGDGWSLAYRVLDAQYWGVPQRRRRIYLVTDFRGGRAREVLFEREGLRGYFTQGRTPWQATPADAQGSVGADDSTGEENGGTDGGDRGRQLDDVAYTLKIRSGCEGGGKGAPIQKDKSATLATNNDQYLFQPVDKITIIDSIGGQAESAWEGQVTPCLRATHYKMPPCVGVTLEPGIAAREGGHIYEGVSGTLRANAGDNQMSVAYSIENHPADSRVNLDESGKVQTLTSRMGTGGGNVPMVMEPKDVYCLQGNGIDRADTAGCNGKGWKEDTAYTLNTIDRPAVAYSAGFCTEHSAKSRGIGYEEEISPTLRAGVTPGVAYGLDRASFNQGQNAKFDFTVTEENQPTLTARGPGAVAQPIYNASKASFFMRATENGAADTLVATDYKDPQLVAYQDKVGSLCATDHKGIRNQDIGEGKASIQEMPQGTRHYIVRRLTPTECARLQGFADCWGDIGLKTELTDKEYIFWLDVRNTHARICGKPVKPYTDRQMLTWYNKLQTDSSEYKMWGNGIALPTALYVLQGITDALDATEMIADELNGAEELIEDWML